MVLTDGCPLERDRLAGRYPAPADNWSAAPAQGQVLREGAFRTGGSSDNWRNLPGSDLSGAFFHLGLIAVDPLPSGSDLHSPEQKVKA